MTTLSLLLLSAQSGRTPVLDPRAYLETPVAGLERTASSASPIDTKGKGFSRALRVTIGKPSQETNATQLTIPNRAPVSAGDILMVSVWLRGRRPDGSAARAEMLFEKSSDPWTKSLTHGLTLSSEWKRHLLPFRASETYAPGAAMLSIRLAYGPQTVEIGPVTLDDRGPNADLEALRSQAAVGDPLGKVALRFDWTHPRQTMRGLGGNFCQPRYGSTDALDAVGRYALANLKVAHARIGLPLEKWTPEPGVYRNDAQAAASLGALREMAQRGIPTVVSIWEGPQWMLGGKPEEGGRTLDPAKFALCADAIAAYLVVARDEYGAKVDYVSFNEPDYGVNFKFTPKTMADFIRLAGPRFAAKGLKTKFLVGDTAGGVSAVAFDTPLLEDASIAPYLGPIAFHCWDVLSASDASYAAIADLGKRFKKPVWCLEAGHDAQLWQAKDPWATWDNALRTAMAYEKTIRLSGATVMYYWTLQDNYPVVDNSGSKPYPAFKVLKAMQDVFASGARVVAPGSSSTELQALATTYPKGRSAFLLVNAQGAGNATIAGLKRGTVYAIVTQDVRGLRRSTAEVDPKGFLTVPLPTRSVVTADEPKP